MKDYSQANVLHELTKVLLENAGPIIKHKMALATGKSSDLDMALVDQATQDEIWKTLVPMLQTTGAREKIDAKTSQDIVKLLANGKVSISDARELMLIMKLGAETEAIEKGGMTALDSAPGVTIVLPSVEVKPKLVGGIHTGKE